MAKKKDATKAGDAAGTQAKALKKKAPATKAAAPKAAAPKVDVKAAAPKKKAAAPKKKAAPVKLTDNQRELLKQVHGAGETGHPAEGKGATKSLEALKEKKLIKRGKKNKETGNVHYHISKAGEKHIGSESNPSA